MSRHLLLMLSLLLVACGAPAASPPTAAPPTETPIPTATPQPTAAPPTVTPQPTVPAPARPAVLSITSSAFEEGGAIADEYACDGVNRSPALAWGDPPEGTQSFALIMEDLDYENYTHWVLFNIPPEVRALEAGIAAGEQLDGIGMHAQNNFAQPGYNGPCPDPGDTHTYQFTLYALNSPLPLNPSPFDPVSKGMVREAMNGRILGEGVLTGVYTRP